jgi:hypothetical protein
VTAYKTSSQAPIIEAVSDILRKYPEILKAILQGRLSDLEDFSASILRIESLATKRQTDR